MAQLLAPVRADLLRDFPKTPSPTRSLAAADRSRTHRHHCRCSRRWQNRDFRIAAAATAAAEGFSSRDDVADDFYAVLGLLPDATPRQIKKAYYNCMKACHPDLSGNDPDVNNFCMFINEVYAVLGDPVQRMVYDEIHGYAVTAVNPFLDDSAPKDHAFVDEFSCIGMPYFFPAGCKNCANVAPDVFQIEEEYGRARVCWQSGNPDLVQEAIDTCPVDCIHWTSAAQLSLLEDEMRRVGLMLAGMGSSSTDVFRMASTRWDKRQAKVLEKAKIRVTKQRDNDKNGSWSNIWGVPKNYASTVMNLPTEEEAVKERAKRAAAAARRWREYSRRGVDRPPTYKLPETISNKES
ncbi:hypothetical protein BHE74_00029412 [Ensete ventricosum]|nr:hypothetical protein GW17_00003793 [Ensete ventricosum]RWW63410.1 hypothetical protein BHE74_00029412 [Ensete ventricosum]